VVRAGEGYFVGVSFLVCAILLGCGGKSERVKGTHGSGGGAGVGGDADSGEPDAHPQLTSSKLDLLLVIDNSGSMADKQEVLDRSATTLISRLANPACTDGSGNVVSLPPGDQPCPPGSTREMPPVRDMHVGVITSSLGGHGGQVCSPAFSPGEKYDPSQDDRGELLLRAGDTYQNRGYLLWDPDQKADPPGESDWVTLASKVSTLVTGAGEKGCGFESTLEAWYRFLIDPEPPAEVTVKDGVAVVEGINQTILEQRAQFLRPDSAVLVVMLSDENDCSTQVGGTAWMAGQIRKPDESDFNLGKATADCATDPNSPCCRSCTVVESEPPSGCAPLSAEAACQSSVHDELGDHLNLRCFDQKRRFGIDFLYPVSRYVRGLTSSEVPDRSGAMVRNPLFVDPGARNPSLVSVAGIIGVPWQDLARDPADTGALRYMTSGELGARGRWKVILGDPARGQPPDDPFMRESIEPRSGKNPLSGDAIQPPTAVSSSASAINGHEWEPPDRGDLQFACIFPLVEPRECASPLDGCDCNTGFAGSNKPLCQRPDGGYGTTQYFAKAYPGLRQLELLRELGDSSIIASICPRNLDDPSRNDYAYRPAVQAIMDRMQDVLRDVTD
jgi:hypothetical protein